MTELRLKREDLEIEWLDDQGLGSRPPGCRVTHIASGVEAESALFRDREENRRNALFVLADRMLSMGNDRVIVESYGSDPIVAG